jgi:hypothetical protein
VGCKNGKYTKYPLLFVEDVRLVPEILTRKSFLKLEVEVAALEFVIYPQSLNSDSPTDRANELTEKQEKKKVSILKVIRQ